jgi:hypothetical protein
MPDAVPEIIRGRLALTGDVISLRLPFAFSRIGECYRGFFH